MTSNTSIESNRMYMVYSLSDNYIIKNGILDCELKEIIEKLLKFIEKKVYPLCDAFTFKRKTCLEISDVLDNG